MDNEDENINNINNINNLNNLNNNTNTHLVQCWGARLPVKFKAGPVVLHEYVEDEAVKINERQRISAGPTVHDNTRRWRWRWR